MKFVNENLVPIGGWQYTQFETGQRLQAGSFPELIDVVSKHRSSNQIEVGNVRSDVENQICFRQPAHICMGGCFEPARLSASSVYDAAIAMTKTITSDSFVDQDEANRRADICSRCFFSQQSKGCFGRCVDSLKEAFHSLIGDRTTRSDDKMMNCEVCGCSCKTIVWIKLDVLNRNLSENSIKSYKNAHFCWKNA